MIFQKFLLLITLILSNAFALKEDEIQSEMTK
ncbi:ABC transporter substrate-binding protein, partial [Arcobacter butzleri]|nr:ABC transporter substrate-binding protein [Aliarcobacter butzleri]